MSKHTPPEFFSWLDEQLKEAGLTDNGLAIKAKIHQSVISKARSNERGIGWDVGVAIAQALQVPPEIVLRRLNLLPASPNSRERSVIVDEILNIAQNLVEADQEELLQIARMKLERYKRGQRGKKQAERM